MIKCYCDASYDPNHNLAIVGYRIGESPINIIIIENTNNTSAEVQGILNLVNTIVNNLDINITKYVIFTDCQSALNRINSKNKIIENDYKTKKGNCIANSEYYKQLFAILDNIFLNHKIIIEFKHINGHLPKNEMNDDNKKFHMLDKFVRKRLRYIIKNK